MKHLEAIELRLDLLHVKEVLSEEVNYALLETLERLNRAILPLEKREKIMNDILKDYDAARIKICQKFATVDGEIKMKKQKVTVAGEDQFHDVYDIPKEKEPALKKEIAALKKVHAKKFKQYDAEMEAYQKFLAETESTVKLCTVKRVHVPKNISTEQYKKIFPLIRKRSEDEE